MEEIVALREEVGEFDIRVIWTDPSFCNPREDDNSSHMLLKARGYALGDSDPSGDDFHSISEMDEYIKSLDDVILVRNVYAYIHGGITISCKPYDCPWDSGLIGFIYITKSRMEYMGFKPEEITVERASTIMDIEIQEYDNYLRGDVYGYIIDGPGYHDRCSGYLGNPELCMDDAKNSIQYHIDYIDDCRSKISEHDVDVHINDYMRYECPECGQLFDNWTDAKQHLMKYHPNIFL